MKSRYSAALLAGSAVCALLSPASSRADTADTAAQAAAPAQVETVVVTAQRRAERSVDAPVSIYVATGEQLHDRGATNFQDLQNYVPGVHMDENGLAFQPTIRGVGSAISGPGDSANVATYIDGFYRPSMNSNNMEFDDVESLQVLKGPQGTLFGRNATGGAFLVTTNAPSFDFNATARVGYGSYNTLDASGFVTGGLSDTVAGSFAGYVSRSDGAVTNVLTGQDQAQRTNWGARAKLLYQPSENLTFTLSYEHTQVDDPTFIAFNAYHGWSDGVFYGGKVLDTRDKTSLDGEPITKVQNDGVYLKGVYDMGWATLTSLTSGAHEQVFNQLDMDSSSAPLELVNWKIHEDTITQEFDLASKPGGPFNWVAGLYYYNDSDVYNNFYVSVFGGPFFTAFADAGQRANSAAAFFDGTYNVWDQLFLTVGARYSYDHMAESFIAGAATNPAESFSHDFNSFTPRAVLRYQLTPDSNVYLSYSQGYKSGVYNVFGAATTPVKPENISAFELGYKTVSSDWSFDAAAYYYNYKNLQINTYVQFTSQLVNAANSEIWGLDANLTRRITDELSANVSAAYTHARYTNFPDDPSYTWDPTSGVVIGTINGKNFTMQRVPEFQMNAGLDYHRALFGGKLDMQGNYGYQSKVYFDPADVTYQKGYGVLNLRASWTDPSGRREYSVYGNNVTDQAYITQVLPIAFAFNQAWASPAVVGGEVRFKY